MLLSSEKHKNKYKWVFFFYLIGLQRYVICENKINSDPSKQSANILDFFNWHFQMKAKLIHFHTYTYVAMFLSFLYLLETMLIYALKWEEQLKTT